MEYNYTDKSEVPDLQDFKEELIEDILKSVFFPSHKSSKKYNMLKIPILSAPSLIRKQINNEFRKESLMEKKFEYEDETLQTFISLVDRKEIRINQTDDLTKSELTKFSRELGIYSVKKSVEVMKIDLNNLTKIFVGGQVNFFNFHFKNCETHYSGEQFIYCINSTSQVELSYAKFRICLPIGI